MSETLKGTCYLTLEPRYASWNPNRVSGFRIVKSTKTKPALTAKQVAFKLSINVPELLFEEVLPSAEVTLPDGALILPELQVDAVVDGGSDE